MKGFFWSQVYCTPFFVHPSITVAIILSSPRYSIKITTMSGFGTTIRTSLVVLCFTFLLCNCKKKDKHVEEEPPIPEPTAVVPSKYFGQFSCTKSVFVRGHALTNTSFLAWAFFSSSPLDSLGRALPNTYVHAGKVILNNTFLKKDSLTISNVTTITYQDTTGIPPALPLTWHFSEKIDSPEFSFTANDNYPTFAGYAQLTDTTLKESEPFIVPLDGVSGADEITVSIIAGTSAFTSTVITKKVSSGSTKVTFTPGELSKLDSYQGDGFVQINLYKSSYFKAGEKYYRFSSTFICSKGISLTN